MANLHNTFDTLDRRVASWMATYGVVLLRISIGVVFFWFGILKFFPALSPAEELASSTIEILTVGIIQPSISLPVLAAWEVLIGLGLITGKFIRATILLLFTQMIGTVTPLFIFPDQTFKVFPHTLTLEGQYIIKNIVLVSAAIVVGATVRGGNMVVDSDLADEGRKRQNDNLKLRRNEG